MSQLCYWIQPGQEDKDFDFSLTGFMNQNPLKLEPNISAICRDIKGPMIDHINMLFQHNSCIYFVDDTGSKITSFLIYYTDIRSVNRLCNIAMLCSGTPRSNQGIKLMETLFKLAENDVKSNKIFLTLSAGGPKLKAYYKKFGFEEDGGDLMKREITKGGGKKRNKTKKRKHTKTRKNKKK
jgi:hypothetical protein